MLSPITPAAFAKGRNREYRVDPRATYPIRSPDCLINLARPGVNQGLAPDRHQRCRGHLVGDCLTSVGW
jgi:hypothetical protein